MIKEKKDKNKSGETTDKMKINITYLIINKHLFNSTMLSVRLYNKLYKDYKKLSLELENKLKINKLINEIKSYFEKYPEKRNFISKIINHIDDS